MSRDEDSDDYYRGRSATTRLMFDNRLMTEPLYNRLITAVRERKAHLVLTGEWEDYDCAEIHNLEHCLTNFPTWTAVLKSRGDIS